MTLLLCITSSKKRQQKKVPMAYRLVKKKTQNLSVADDPGSARMKATVKRYRQVRECSGVAVSVRYECIGGRHVSIENGRVRRFAKRVGVPVRGKKDKVLRRKFQHCRRLPETLYNKLRERGASGSFSRRYNKPQHPNIDLEKSVATGYVSRKRFLHCAR